METIKVSSEDILQIKRDIEFIKDQFTEETELTDWAKKELEMARNTPISECISHEEVGKLFFNK